MDKSMRAAVIAGNWKMHKSRQEAADFIDELLPLVKDAGCKIVVCVPFTDLQTVAEALRYSDIHLGAQNCHWAASGAFTGEISPAMLRELGVEFVIIGHSERRQYFGDTDETVNGRLIAALSEELNVILCVGETLAQRESGETHEVISRQVRLALAGVPSKQLCRVIIAYEPVWAIGTGKTAAPQQAGEACGLIRAVIGELYGEAFAETMTIQYGGSMNAQNAEELLAQPDIDGGLIGGASLNATDFADIIEIAGR